jgi:hypothetical protein
MIETRRIGTEVLVRVLAGLSVVVCVWQEVEARDLFTPKEQATTEADPHAKPVVRPKQKKGIPQSLFTWIKMAKGYEVEWDTFGQKGLVHARSSAEAHRAGIGVSSGYLRNLYCVRISPAGRSYPV